MAEQRRRDEAFCFAMRNYKPVYRFDGTSWIIDQARTDAAFEEAKRKCEGFAAARQKPRQVTMGEFWEATKNMPFDQSTELFNALRAGTATWEGRPAKLVGNIVRPVDPLSEGRRIAAAKNAIADLRIRHEHLMANVAAATREFDARPNPTECRRADGALRWRVNDPMHARRAAVAKARYDSPGKPTSAGE